MALSTTNFAEALDVLGLKSITYGIRPIWEVVLKIADREITLKLTAAGETKIKHPFGGMVIKAVETIDSIVINNASRLDTFCRGGILATGTKYNVQK